MSAMKILFLLTTVVMLTQCALHTANVQIESPTELDDSSLPTAGEIDSDDSVVASTDSAPLIRFNFSYPEGWTPSTDDEDNQLTLRHENGAVISFAVWPIDEQMSPLHRIYGIFEIQSEAEEQGISIEIGNPTEREFGGVGAAYLISVLTATSGARITLMDAAFPTNYPTIGVHISGYWPEALDVEMMLAFRQIAQSIRVVEQ
ncbi:MAG: hypothetical protein V1738_05335 [Patescibacteria group bacterium]